RLVQPVGENRYAVVYPYGVESLDYHYERNPKDPRMGHQVTLDVDDYGQVKKSAAIGYPRRTPGYPQQNQLLGAYTAHDLINKPDEMDFYRLGVAAESCNYEITGLTPSNTIRFTWDELSTGIANAAPIAFDMTPAPPPTVQKRLLKRACSLYYNHDLS